MDPSDITNEKSLWAWLNDQPRDTAVVIAHRVAMRAAPYFWQVAAPVSAKSNSKALPVCRALLICGVAGKRPTPQIKAAAASADRYAAAAARYAASAADAAARYAAADARFAAADARYAAAAAAADAAARAASAARYAAAIAALAADAADAAAAASAAAFWEMVRADAARPGDAAACLSVALWNQGDSPVAEAWQEVSAAWTTAGPDWDFWRRWYQAALDGRPLIADDWIAHWSLLEQIALIDPDESRLWSDPTALAAEIRRIETEALALREGTPLSRAAATDFFCDTTLMQMKLTGFDDDLAHLRDPEQVTAFLDDIGEARDGLQDFADYASEAKGPTNAPAVLQTAAEKMLKELQRASDSEHVRARRIVMLGKQLRGFIREDAKRDEIGETLAAILDDSVGLLETVCRKHFAPSIEVLAALDSLDLEGYSPAEVIARFEAALAEAETAQGTEVSLSPEAVALLRDMLDEMKDTQAAIDEASSASLVARWRHRLAREAGALGATLGKLYERSAPHKKRANDAADTAIKEYKRWKSFSDIIEWLQTFMNSGPPPTP